MSSDRMETIPDLNLPYKTHQTEVPSEVVLIDFPAPIREDGAIVPADTEKLLLEKHRNQMEIPGQDACNGLTGPISRDVDHANGVADVAGSTVPADTEKLLFEKHWHHVEVRSQDASIGFMVPISRDVDHANGVADVSGSIVPANTGKLLFKQHGHQVKVLAQDPCMGVTAPISRDASAGDHAKGVADVSGAIVPDDTEKLLFEKHQLQVEFPAQDASIGLTTPISRDVDHANGVLDVTGAIFPADTEKLSSKKHRHQVEVPAQDACIGFTAPISRDASAGDHANGVADVSGVIVPANTEKVLFEKHQLQVEFPAQDASIGLTAPISRDADHANGVADVAGAIFSADTEKLSSKKHRHQVEVPAQDACIGFTASISRDVDHANGVVDVAGASADTEKLLFKKHRHFWEVAESFESCRKMRQEPHFLPLKSCKEVLREGQALGKMVTFDNIAKKTLNFHLDTKREAIKDDLSLLEELETHGFNVEILKYRLNRLLLMKNEEEKVKNMLEQRKRVVSGYGQEKRKFKETRAKAEEGIKELQKGVELALEIEKAMKDKTASVQLADRDNDEKRRRIEMQIEELKRRRIEMQIELGAYPLH